MDVYKTVSGDYWDLISYKVYGSEIYTTELMKANPEYLNVMVFSAGMEIVCPDIEIKVSSNLPPWKRGVLDE